MSSNYNIGADEARAPIAICGYFSLIQAANTAQEIKEDFEFYCIKDNQSGENKKQFHSQYLFKF